MRWVRHLVLTATVLASGALVGSGIASLVAGSLPIVPVALEPRRAIVAAEDEPSVLAGRLFAPDPPSAPSPPDPEALARCAAGWALVGALVDRRHPERSIAAVHAPDGAAVLGLGAAHGARTLIAVTHTEARFRADDGTECALSMFEERSLTAVTLPAESPPPPREAPRVTRLADDHYRVDRAALEAAQASEAGVVVRPAFRDGAMIGARVYGVRRGGLLDAAGIQNGDVIVAVDGAPLTSPTVGLDAYGRLMRGDAVSVTVERRGVRREVRYELE